MVTTLVPNQSFRCNAGAYCRRGLVNASIDQHAASRNQFPSPYSSPHRGEETCVRMFLLPFGEKASALYQ